MVLESIDPAVIGLIGVIVGASINETGAYVRERRASEAENTRRRAEFYLDKKVNALSTLYVELNEGNRVLNKYGNKASTAPENIPEEEYHDEVHPIPESYLKALRDASIYLTKEQDEILHETLGQFRLADTYIANRIANPNSATRPEDLGFDFEEFRDTYQDSKSVIKEEINTPIEEFED